MSIQSLKMNRPQSKTETSLYYGYGLSPSNIKTPKQQAQNFYIPIGFAKCNSPSSLTGLSGSFSEIASFSKYSSSLKTPISSSPKRITVSQKGWSVKTALTKELSPNRLSADLGVRKKPKNSKKNELKFRPQNSLSLITKSIEKPITPTGKNRSPPHSMVERLRKEKINQLKLTQSLIRYKHHTSEEVVLAKSNRNNKVTSDHSLRKHLDKQKGTEKNSKSSLLSNKIDPEKPKSNKSGQTREQILEPENKLSILIEDHWRPGKVNQEDFPKSSSSIGEDSNKEATPKSDGLYAKVRAVCERNIHLSPRTHEREKIQQVFEFYNKPDIKLISRDIMGRRSGKLTLYKNEAHEDLANQDKTCFPGPGKTTTYIPKINKNFAQPQSQPQNFIFIQDNNDSDRNTSARFGGNMANENFFGDAESFEPEPEHEPEIERANFSFQKEEQGEEDVELENNILISNAEHSFC